MGTMRSIRSNGSIPTLERVKREESNHSIGSHSQTSSGQVKSRSILFWDIKQLMLHIYACYVLSCCQSCKSFKINLFKFKVQQIHLSYFKNWHDDITSLLYEHLICQSVIIFYINMYISQNIVFKF